MMSRVDPLTLFVPERLDLVIKWRYFRHLLTGQDRDAERVYRRHIVDRTNGREPGSWKQSVDDYVRGAVQLCVSMQERGFDPLYPVRLGSDGKLKGGAHRTACAMALDLPTIVVHTGPSPGRATPWDAVWLKRFGMSDEDLRRVEQDWHTLHGLSSDDHDQARHLLHG